MRWFRDNKDYLFLQWFRNASNVSPLFRQELGEVFWSRVCLKSNTGDVDMWRIPAFLGDRPAVWRGIKPLDMDLSVDTMDDSDMDPSFSSRFSEYGGSFTAWCAYISATLELEVLKFRITIEEDQLDPVGKGEDKYACLKACRRIPVTDDFQIFLCVRTPDSGSDTEDEEKREAREEKLEEKYAPMVRQFMWPDILRRKPTEESVCLDSRPRPPPLPVEASPAPAQPQCIVM